MGNGREDYGLIAHLMRRAGFGATPDEVEEKVKQGYEETVEELIEFERFPPVDQYLLYRYFPVSEMPGGVSDVGQTNWFFHMMTTKRPLEEKMALFWHYVFATGNNKVDNCTEMLAQIEMFREYGMGDYRELLLQISRDPAMIFWLDNNENHKYAINENWGRELLELFSMGVGNYTETDVYDCSRAFTGWTFQPGPPRAPMNRFKWQYRYLPEDHDEGEKQFLGHSGNLNGEDIIDIVVQQPACHRFIARHLYNFFVADESQVPAWNVTAPRDPDAIDFLARTFVESDLEIKPVLRALFNSDFFKSPDVRYQKVRSPIEVVVNTLKMTKEFSEPVTGFLQIIYEAGYSGQDILDPPSVEGWHTGKEWINSGALVSRVNFIADRFSNTELPGVKRIVDLVASSNGKSMSPDQMVEQCLEVLGRLEVEDSTRAELVSQASQQGTLSWESDEEYEKSALRVTDTLALIAATKEYQFE